MMSQHSPMAASISDALTTRLDAVAPVRPVVSLTEHDDERLLVFAGRFEDAFARAPRVDASHARQWALLLAHAYELLRVFAEVVDIRFAPTCPYTSMEELRADVLEHRRLVITTEHSVHPLWSPEENGVFRVVHDIVPHVLHGREFSLRGELLAFHDHLRRAPPGCELALFTELVAYAAVRYTTGDYPPAQKACVFPELFAAYMATMTGPHAA